MMEELFLLFSFLRSGLKNQTELALENLALRQQPAILKRNRPHPSLLRSVAFTTITNAVLRNWDFACLILVRTGYRPVSFHSRLQFDPGHMPRSNPECHCHS